MRISVPKFSAAVLAVAVCTLGQTPVFGIIDKDVEWRVENSPYILMGDVFVTPNAVLKIEAGTTVEVLGRDSAKTHDSLGAIVQLDESDSQMVALKVRGGLLCTGSPDSRIVFKPRDSAGKSPIKWYGIVLQAINEDYTEMGFVDVSGAVYGVRMETCKPEVFGSLFSYNNTGVYCGMQSSPFVRNNTIAYNVLAGVYARGANARILCNIIAFNQNHGIWGDGVTHIDIGYNCIYGNRDDNLVDCPVNVGRLVRINARGDSCDKKYNIYMDPIFAGSVSDSIAIEEDLSLNTDVSRVKDTTLAKAANKELKDNQAAKVRHAQYPKYSLSGYSPCIDAGRPSKVYNDLDESVNDMGAYGGPISKVE